MELVEERLKQSDAQGGWLLDGYPRTVSQAAHLDTVARPHKVINITLEHRIAVQKMQGRRHCRCALKRQESSTSKYNNLCIYTNLHIMFMLHRCQSTLTRLCFVMSEQ
eukprot:TRINITY_DN456_c0_g1_i5.p2 TRINITY_DN456_c0_g1~~TRINITY_DN456_c0_g1_i5.p2  ORF type:complete len:108 (+),score=8.33 TRINITY_DN456_c0_g1_i5:323-646(+)